MIGTAIWRAKEALAVLLGKKKTERLTEKKHYPRISKDNLPQTRYATTEEETFINSLDIEFIFSEFREERVNAGGNDLSHYSRLDPSLSTLKHYFPNARFTVYSDFDLKAEDVALKKIEKPALENMGNPRHYYHLADYYKFRGMLNSEADVAVAIDSDMFVFSDNIYKLIRLTERFGFCVPNSSAQCMNYEIATSLDTLPITDESGGFGTTVNITPLTLAKNSQNGRKYYESCCDFLQKQPSRASIVMWKAAWATGTYPYLLPKEFCVVRGTEGISNEILLHVGHKSVAEYYNIEM